MYKHKTFQQNIKPQEPGNRSVRELRDIKTCLQRHMDNLLFMTYPETPLDNKTM